MSLDLSTLALYTQISPAVNIGVYARPYKPSSDRVSVLLRCRGGKYHGVNQTQYITN